MSAELHHEGPLDGDGRRTGCRDGSTAPCGMCLRTAGEAARNHYGLRRDGIRRNQRCRRAALFGLLLASSRRSSSEAGEEGEHSQPWGRDVPPSPSRVSTLHRLRRHHLSREYLRRPLWPVRGERLAEIPFDTQRIEDEVRKIGARLVVVDPLMAFLGGDVNTNRDHDVRRALSGLKSLAERTGAAVLVVRHLNKEGRRLRDRRGLGGGGSRGARRPGPGAGRAERARRDRGRPEEAAAPESLPEEQDRRGWKDRGERRRRGRHSPARRRSRRTATADDADSEASPPGEPPRPTTLTRPPPPGGAAMHRPASADDGAAEVEAVEAAVRWARTVRRSRAMRPTGPAQTMTQRTTARIRTPRRPFRPRRCAHRPG